MALEDKVTTQNTGDAGASRPAEHNTHHFHSELRHHGHETKSTQLPVRLAAAETVGRTTSFVPNIELASATPTEADKKEGKNAAKVATIKVTYHHTGDAGGPDVLIHADGTVTSKDHINSDLKTHNRKVLVVQIEPPADGKVSAELKTKINQECTKLAENHFASDDKGKKTGSFDDKTGLVSAEVKAQFSPPTASQQAALETVRSAPAPSAAELTGRTWSPHEYRTTGGGYGGNGGFGIPRGEGSYIDKSFSWDKIGGLDRTNPVDRVLAITGSGESGINPTAINWSDNGHGISVGLFQANQKSGELPLLFEMMASTSEGFEVLVQLFGKDLAEAIRKNPELIRNLDLAGQYKAAMLKLVHNELFQKSELEMGRKKAVHAMQIAARHGIHSEAGAAIVMYAINQFGEGGAQKFLSAADSVGGEEQKTEAVVSAIKSRTQYGTIYDRALSKVVAADLSFQPGSTGQA